MRHLRIALPLLVASGVSVLLAAALPETILAGDAVSYRERMSTLFSGAIPYVDYAFEHLPGMVIPMGVAWLLGGSGGLPTFTLALAGVSAICLLVCSLVLLRVEDHLMVPGLTVRWLVVTVPTLPFLLFRNDAWSLMLAVLGIWLAMKGRKVLSLALLTLGILSKAWPAAWSAAEWWRGHRWRAIGLGSAFLLSVLIILSPAVQTIQDPQGLHTETLLGSVVALIRSVRGVDLGLSHTATAYLEAPGWTVVLNLAVGSLLAGWSLRRLREPFSWPGAWVLMGGLVGSGMLAAPYLSTQYVAWLAPFVAIERRLTMPMLFVSTASLVLISTWFQLFEGNVWWWGLLFIRNVAIVAIVVGLAAVVVQAADTSTDQPVVHEGI